MAGHQPHITPPISPPTPGRTVGEAAVGGMAAQAGGNGGDGGAGGLGGGGGGGGDGSGGGSLGGRPVGDDYVLEKQIGSGSFSVVWRGRRRSTGDAVAIKEIPTEKLSAKLHESLESEIAILKRARHPNIVHLLDIVKTSSRMFLVLEYCAGGDLSHHIRRGGAVKEAAARHFMRQLGAGLQVLRANNLIHRDLKPQNLLLSERTSAAVLKIADFGFARSLQPQGLAETLCGSPLYMAPEILQCQRYDAKADLWSVGAILFELVVGRPPFGGQNHVHLLQNIKRSEARVPRDIAATLSDDCLGLIRSLLKRNPGESHGRGEGTPHSIPPPSPPTPPAHPLSAQAEPRSPHSPQSIWQPPASFTNPAAQTEPPPLRTEPPPLRTEPPPFPAEPPSSSAEPPPRPQSSKPPAAVSAPTTPATTPSAPAASPGAGGVAPAPPTSPSFTPLPHTPLPPPSLTTPAPVPPFPPPLDPPALPAPCATPLSAPPSPPYRSASPHLPPGPSFPADSNPVSAATVNSDMSGAVRGDSYKEDSDPWGLVRPLSSHHAKFQQQQGQQQQRQNHSALVSKPERGVDAAAAAGTGAAGAGAGAGAAAEAVLPPAAETTVQATLAGLSLAATVPLSVAVAPSPAPPLVPAPLLPAGDERGGTDSFEMLEGDYVVVDHPSEPSLSADQSASANPSLSQSSQHQQVKAAGSASAFPAAAAAALSAVVGAVGAAAAAAAATAGSSAHPIASARVPTTGATAYAVTTPAAAAATSGTGAAAATAVATASGAVAGSPLIPPVESPPLFPLPPNHLLPTSAAPVNNPARVQSLSVESHHVQSHSLQSQPVQPHSLQTPSVQSQVVVSVAPAPLVQVSGFCPKVCTGGFTKAADTPPVTGTTAPPFSTLLSSTPPFSNTTVTTNNSSAAAAPSASAPSPTTAPSPSLPPPTAPAPSHARSGLALAVSLGTPRTGSLARPAPGSLGSDVGAGVGVSVSAASSLSAAGLPAGGEPDRGGLMQNEQQKGQTQQQMQIQQQEQQVFQQHPQERIAFLRQSGRYIAEIAASKLEAAAPLASLSVHLVALAVGWGKRLSRSPMPVPLLPPPIVPPLQLEAAAPLASLSLHLVALAVWKEALTLSHEWAATSATSTTNATIDTYNGGAHCGDAYNGGASSGSGGMIPVRRSSSVGGHGGSMGGHGGSMGGHGGSIGAHGGSIGAHGGSMGAHGSGEEAAAAMACDLVEAEFLAAVETAETVAAAVDRDGECDIRKEVGKKVMSYSIGKWAAAAVACDLVEAEFLAAVETAEIVAAAVDRDEAEFVAAVETAEAVAAAVDRDDPSPVPDALEMVYQTALIAGRSAAVSSPSHFPDCPQCVFFLPLCGGVDGKHGVSSSSLCALSHALRLPPAPRTSPPHIELHYSHSLILILPLSRLPLAGGGADGKHGVGSSSLCALSHALRLPPTPRTSPPHIELHYSRSLILILPLSRLPLAGGGADGKHGVGSSSLCALSHALRLPPTPRTSPPHIELHYSRSLILILPLSRLPLAGGGAGGKHGVEELMGNMASAAAAYARSATLFAFLLHLAPRLPISPPLRLSPADRHRLTKYHDGVLARQTHCSAALHY
ncbi:unnamed protein product [Closterium sp. NIES-64]|nr:unnamed protein product [Closterium sp. NIES-64]